MKIKPGTNHLRSKDHIGVKIRKYETFKFYYRAHFATLGLCNLACHMKMIPLICDQPRINVIWKVCNAFIG